MGTLRQSTALGQARCLFRGSFCFFGSRLFFARELFAEFLGERGVVHQAQEVPLEEFPHAFAGAPPEVELQEQRADEGEVELAGDSSRTLCQPVSAAHEAFYPAEKILHLLQVLSLSKGHRFFVKQRGVGRAEFFGAGLKALAPFLPVFSGALPQAGIATGLRPSTNFATPLSDAARYRGAVVSAENSAFNRAMISSTSGRRFSSSSLRSCSSTFLRSSP